MIDCSTIHLVHGIFVPREYVPGTFRPQHLCQFPRFQWACGGFRILISHYWGETKRKSHERIADLLGSKHPGDGDKNSRHQMDNTAINQYLDPASKVTLANATHITYYNSK